MCSDHVSLVRVDSHPQPITGAERHGHCRDHRVLGHYLERVGLGNSCQGEVHFQEGERFANTSPRPFAKGEVGTPVPPGFLRRRKTFWLKLLGLGPNSGCRWVTYGLITTTASFGIA